MEYSELADAIKNNDSSRIREMMNTLMPRLQRFLLVHMNASETDAEDCAQDTILSCLETIHEGRLKNPDRILSFLLTSCRNNYLNMINKKKEQYFEEMPDERNTDPRQLKNLIEEERMQILQWCLEQLKEEYRKFMEYWFHHPDSEAEEVAEHFNLSVSNTWTRKHRIIGKLNDCYSEKSKL